jgi:hypothetical protein
MAYGTVKVDNITFDNGGSDQNVTVSGLYRATTSGVTVSGTIVAATVSGVTIIGSTTVSGATVTGTTANFTSGNFSNIISSAATMSGALIMADQQQVRFREAVGNGVNHIALQAPAIVSADQTITLPDQTGTVVTTGDNGSVTSTMILDGTILNADINASAAIAGTKISPDFGSQTIVTTGVHSAAAGSATTPSIAFTGDLNTGIYSPGADQLALSTAGNGRLFIDGTGFVGIGTVPAVGYGLDVRGLARLLTVGGPSGLEIGTGTATNQSAYLDLVGDATYTDYGLRVLRDSTGANADSTIRHKGTGVLALITEEAGSITLATNSTERARIDSSGNVGIGTSSPSDMLSIVKTDTSNSLFDSDAAITITNPNSDTFGRSTNLNFNQGTDASIGRLASIAGVYTNFSTSVGGALAFSTNNGSGTVGERLRIDSSGNVGIGTSSPSSSLTVNGKTTLVGPEDGQLEWSLGGQAWRANIVSGGKWYLYDATNAKFPLDVVTNSTCKIDINTSHLAFNTGSSERLRITSAGLVGIGTSFPRGNVSIANNDVSGVVDSSLHFGYSLADYYGHRIVNSNNPSSQSAGLLKFQRGTIAAWVDSVVIDNSGHVGIGTSSPEAAHLLQANGVIASVSSFGAFTALESAGGTGFRWTLANDGTFRLQRTTDSFSTATTPIFIDSSNRVGIGTTSPSFNLVSANSTTDGGWLYSSGSVSTLGLGGYSLAGDGAFHLKYDRSTGDITFNGGSRDTPVERLRIDSSGRLLVGTSAERSNFFNTTITANILLENDNAVLGVVRNGNNAFSPYLVLAKSRSASNTIVQADDQLGSVNFQGNDGTEFVEAAQIAAFVDGTPGANDMPGRLVFSTAADGAAFATERLRITSAGVLQVADAGNITVGTTTGTKIGTATTQKIGFYNATPVVQPTAVADATDAASAITQLNALLTRMRNLGLIAT